MQWQHDRNELMTKNGKRKGNLRRMKGEWKKEESINGGKMKNEKNRKWKNKNAERIGVNIRYTNEG